MLNILKNKYMLISIVTLLLVFNYIKWTGDNLLTEARNNVTKNNNIDFSNMKLVSTNINDKKIKVYRDLFHPAKRKKVKPKKIVKAKPKPKGPPPLTPEQIAHNKAKLQLAQVKVMGIMEQGGFKQAFIMYNDDTFIVKKGEKFAELFQVSNISVGKVDVMELKTTLSKTIKLDQ